MDWITKPHSWDFTQHKITEIRMVSDDGFVTHLDTAVGIISQFMEMVKRV